MPDNLKITLIAATAFFLSVSAYSCSSYHSEEQRQTTARMDICIRGGGTWVTAWNWKTYCKPKGA